MSEVEQPDVLRIAAFACEQERETILAIVRAVKAEGHPIHKGGKVMTGWRVLIQIAVASYLAVSPLLFLVFYSIGYSDGKFGN